MKICVLHSSYEGSSSPFAEFDPYQDPRRYVPPDYHHQFTLEYIRKDTAKEQLNAILTSEPSYDLYWNFMWGTDDYGADVAGLEATRYLESLGVPFIGPSSKFLAMTKVEMKQKVEQFCAGRVRTPKWTVASALNLDGLKFPLIVKPAIGCGSEYMTTHCISDDEPQLKAGVSSLRSKMAGDGRRSTEILIEEFVEGKELAVMVLESEKDSVIALEPVIFEFPSEWGTRDKILHFDNKFFRDDVVTHRIYDDDQEIVDKLRASAVAAYCALEVRGCGFARVDFRLSELDREPYMLEVNQIPAFFARLGNSDGDDTVIERTFPGGHPAFIDAIVNAKLKLIREVNFSK